MTSTYSSCGLTIRSEIALPGLVALQDRAEPDLRFVRGTVPAAVQDATYNGLNWQFSDRQFRLHVDGVATFLLSDGRDVIVDSHPDCDPDAVALFLTGTVLGILLHQRGQVVLHASAVLVDGRAVLFCGPSAIGKSTQSVALSMRGFQVLCDDICALHIAADGTPTVSPDGRRSKLWAEAIAKMDLSDRMGRRVRHGLEKHYLDDHPDSAERPNQPVPLRSLYWLRNAGATADTDIRKLNVADFALLVQNNAYRPRLVHAMKQEGLYMRAAAAMMPHVAAYNFWRPRGFDQMDAVLDMLQDHWRNTGD